MLLFAFVLLLVSFRSLVIPVTAVILNLLSVAAAYGVIVALFQWGWGQSLLGFTSVHSVASWLPLFLFVVLFGLSIIPAPRVIAYGRDSGPGLSPW